jgi:regulator of protease activity HflC (stomatin/prohibitin superfamily)
MIEPKKLIIGSIGAVLLIVLVALSGQIFENVDAGEFVVIQAPISGELTWYTTPGLKLQMFGKVTHYPKSNQYWFSSMKDQGKNNDQSIRTTFNDGGVGNISGSVRYDLPVDEKALTALHTKYGSHNAIEHELIRTVMERSVFMSGPAMSSAESYAQRRPELMGIIEDQAANGIYQVRTKEQRIKDPISGQDKTIKVVEFVKSDNSPGGLARQEESPLKEFGIRLYNFSINGIDYSKQVTDQIAQQQDIAMKIQTSMAEAKQAEQRAITAEQNGKADAAQQKWKEEAAKAAAVTIAEKEKQVKITQAEADKQQLITQAEGRREQSRLDKEASEFYKQTQILRGEGDGSYKKIVMQADGALQQKLDAVIAISKAQAEAISKYHGNLVPQVVFGGGTNNQTGFSVQDMLGLMMLNNAKNIGLDLSVQTQKRND